MNSKELQHIAQELAKLNDKMEKLIQKLSISRDLIIEEAKVQIYEEQKHR